MGTVLAMLEIDGPTDALLAAGVELERRLTTPDGLLARIVAPTATGITLWQLWESADARERNANDPRHEQALRTSGILALADATRSRTFDDAVLQVFATAPQGRG
jgi:hypothetical protein